MAGSTFWNRMARRYIAAPVGDPAAYQRKLELTQVWLKPETELLEIGGGSGATARHHAPLVRHVDSIDYSQAMVTHQRAAAAQAGLTNIRAEVAALEDWPETRAYDAILAMSVLHLLHDRTAALAKIARLLRPGGVLISSTICLAPTSPLRFLLAVPSGLGLIPQVSFFTVDTLKAEMQAAGLTVVSIWQPKPRAAQFIVARKAGDQARVATPAA